MGKRQKRNRLAHGGEQEMAFVRKALSPPSEKLLPLNEDEVKIREDE